MLLYPVLAECVYRVGTVLAPKHSWLRTVTSQQDWKDQKPLQGPVVWMHCASLGEFEMGKPILESYLATVPNAQAVVTFFSPSGYEPRKNYSKALVHYLPFDAPSEVEKWQDYCNPSVALFIRYDLWPNHIAGLRKRSIPAIVSGMSAPKTPWFLSRYLPLVRRNFMCGIQHWGMVEDSDAEIMSRSGVHSEVLGNPKFDYAQSLIDIEAPTACIKWKSAQTKPVFLVGSAHFEDVVFLKAHLDWSSFTVWIVPHNLKDSAEILGSLPEGLNVALDADTPGSTDVLIVENFGVLRNMYSIADYVFIGGGFGKAVHNVLEATAAGKAVASGPNTAKMPENAALIREGLLVPCSSSSDLDTYVSTTDVTTKEKALNMLKAHSGAVEKTVDLLKKSVQL